MAEDLPQIYLVTPAEFELSAFLPRLEACLDAVEVACLRLALGGADEGRIGKAADGLREVAHARDIPIVIETHGLIAKAHGLDGVHLMDGARQVRLWRKEFGEDGIVGAFCSTSRHEGLNAGEIGADYVSFGPTGASALGRGETVDPDVYAWWSEMIEVPVVAEGALTEDLVRALTPQVDFFAIGEEIWREEDAAEALMRLAAARS
ncbi:thiamine phosphate synthase [Pseudoroseicyclus tamaricis]|uniref:Thiamine phosphate synthase n=1 Tax=Pseudoroseicyclus tamaricis TaxID=2705421 RepID=A0A6B2JZ20_9RHOB|nr:thiamine phosphate synthase [Pseudoroseicyclus tamaricis]NDV00622.1 thiamine phosphate synthase [Pseudoroseicyclus tamaricis]